MSMTSNIVGITVPVVLCALIAIPACMPNARTAIKAKLSNMDTEIGMAYSIDILEVKKQEMRKSFGEITKRIAVLNSHQTKHLKQKELISEKLNYLKTHAKTKKDAADIKSLEARAAVFNRICENYEAAIKKLLTMKSKILFNIQEHDRNIELIKSKKLYAESLKSINGYIGTFEEDTGISIEKINSSIEETITEQEALMSSMEEINKIDIDDVEIGE